MQKTSGKDFTFTGYLHQHLETARALRREMTPAEKQLWYQYCRKSPYRFYRQRSIDRFIADFYCAAAGLIIELDGSHHFTQDGKQYDAIRTDILERYDLQVLRFSNRQVMTDFGSVCAAIDQAIEIRLAERNKKG